MIRAAVKELSPIIGTRPACRALNAAPATIYRHRRPATPKQERERSPSSRRPSPTEEAEGLKVLRSKRFVDSAPAQVIATLLDEGRYFCSDVPCTGC